MHVKLYSAILIIPGAGSWSPVQMIVLSVLTPHPNTEPIRLDLLTLPAWSVLSTSVTSVSAHVCGVSCHHLNITDTVTPRHPSNTPG